MHSKIIKVYSDFFKFKFLTKKIQKELQNLLKFKVD